MAKIAILLATYNGEKYLKQQIESILDQTNTEWILYIRDDGSTDSTINIIEEYAKKYINIVFCEDHFNHRGAMNSFIWMMTNIASEYYMFCDQDDFWLSNKIEVCFNELLKLENKNFETPVLIYTDLFIVNESLAIIAESMWKYMRLDRVMDLKYLLIGSFVSGCTMLFNHSAKLFSLKYVNKAIMHDSLLALAVSVSGGIVKGIPNSLIYYRQHNSNTLGASKYNNSFIYRLKNIKFIIQSNYQYYLFVNSIIKISLLKFFLIKIEAVLKIRKIF